MQSKVCTKHRKISWVKWQLLSITGHSGRGLTIDMKSSCLVLAFALLLNDDKSQPLTDEISPKNKTMEQ